MDIVFWIGMGLIGLFLVRVVFWLIEDLKNENEYRTEQAGMDLLKLLDLTLVMYTIAMLVQRVKDRRSW